MKFDKLKKALNEKQIIDKSGLNRLTESQKRDLEAKVIFGAKPAQLQRTTFNHNDYNQRLKK